MEIQGKMIMKKFCSILITALALGASTLLEASCGNKALKELEEGFDNPPAECHPSVWWHWMNGMVTPEGIRKDLLWMDRIVFIIEKIMMNKWVEILQ